MRGTPDKWAEVASNILPLEMAAKDFPCQEEMESKFYVIFRDALYYFILLFFLMLSVVCSFGKDFVFA